MYFLFYYHLIFFCFDPSIFSFFQFNPLKLYLFGITLGKLLWLPCLGNLRMLRKKKKVARLILDLLKLN